jgi:hypothetical protein
VGDVFWDRRAARWRDSRGTFRSEADVRAGLDAATDRVAAEMRQLTIDQREGRLSLTAWNLEMRSRMKSAHLMALEMARGGRAQLTDADLGRVGRRLREQYGFLDRLTTGIRDGTVPNDGRLLSRVELYAEAARPTFERAREEEEALRGRDEVLCDLDEAAEHCEGPGSCVEQRDFGWMALDDPRRVRIGQRLCRNRCRCRDVFRVSAGVPQTA